MYVCMYVYICIYIYTYIYIHTSIYIYPLHILYEESSPHISPKRPAVLEDHIDQGLFWEDLGALLGGAGLQQLGGLEVVDGQIGPQAVWCAWYF